MQFSPRSKNWFVILLIIISGLLGGILGNWIYMYVLDTYYNIPQGNYLSSSHTSNIVVRNPQKNTSPDNIFEALSVSENNLVGIFKRTDIYLPENKSSQGLVLTSDGWIVITSEIETPKKENWKDYVAIANDKKVYTIDQIIFDAHTGLHFVHLVNAHNLPVKDFISSHDLVVGQEVLGLEWRGIAQAGEINNSIQSIRSSDQPLRDLPITGFPNTSLVIFDNEGRIIGFTRGSQAFSMDSINNIFNRLLTTGKIEYPRLGVTYINLDALPVDSGEGALLIVKDKIPAVIIGSPAQKAGLQAGDIIISFENENLSSINDLASLLTKHAPGDTVTITILRKKETKRLSITLDSLGL